MVNMKGEVYKFYIDKIASLYKEFIDNYYKLNKIFDFSNPVEINTMFNYLLYRGYLSNGKNFEFSDNNTIDLQNLSGVNIINGNAVCRHISEMLKNILEKEKIESYLLGVNDKNTVVFNFKNLKQFDFSKKEILSCIKTYLNKINKFLYAQDLITNFFEKMHIDADINLKDSSNFISNIIGNHAIVLAEYDEKKYFLNPTSSIKYIASKDNNGMLLDDFGETKIKAISTILLNNILDYFNIKKKLNENLPSISREEMQEIINRTLTICNNNLDIFNNFYKENSELYGEMSYKLSKINKNHQ